MSSFVRPRYRYNRQICQDLKCNVGKNQYGLANQKPNNPLYFSLSAMKKAMADGKFMTQTVTGTKLPNPIKQLKEFVKPMGRTKNPPGPRMPKNQNSFISRPPENQAENNQVRRQAMRVLQQQIRGRRAVARPPPNPPPRSVIDAQTRRNLFNTVEIPSNLTAEERKSFTFSPMPKVQRGLGAPATPVQEITNKANQEALSEMDSFYKKIIKQDTPRTQAQSAVPPRERARRRRRLALGDNKNEKKLEEGRAIQAAILDKPTGDSSKETKED